MSLKSQIENANALGRANLNAKGVQTDGTETTYEIMSKIADVQGGGTNQTQPYYIESSGTQYIDTGIIPTNHRLKIKFQKNDTSGSSIFGTYGTSSKTDSYELTWYQNKWYYSNGQYNSNHPTVPPLVTNVIELDYFTFDNKVIMNGVDVGTTLDTSVSSRYLYLFGKNNVSIQLSSMKLWYAKIYDRDTQELVRDFIPAIDNDGVVCLYDNVTKAYFYNQGDGDFVAYIKYEKANEQQI